MPSSLSHSGTASAIAASLAPLLLPSEREQVRLSSSLPASLSSTPPQSVPTKSRNDLFTLDWSPVTPNLSKGPLPPPSLAPLAIPPRPARPPQLVLPPTPPLDSHYLRPPSSSSPKPRSYTQTPSRPPLARQHEPPPDDEAGSSSNPILDTRQSPRLRLSPTKEYHLGEGRHASVYLASYIPLSPAPSSSISRTPSSTSTSSTSSRTPWTLCAAKRIHPDRDSQLAGLGEAFVLSRLASSSHHILGLYGVKDERNGIEEIEAVSRRSSYGSAAGARRQASFQARVEMVPPLGSPSLESGEFGIPTQVVDAKLARVRKGPRHSEPVMGRRELREEEGRSAGEKRIVLLLEYCPFGHVLGSLRRFPERVGKRRWMQWAKELVGAVVWMHEKGILHGDIKPHNVLVAQDLSLRLSDFGMSQFLPPPSSSTPLPTDPLGLGSPAYSPPEFVQPPPSPFSFPSDIFSLGVTLSVLLSAHEPYEGLRAVERMFLVARGGYWEWEERRRLGSVGEVETWEWDGRTSQPVSRAGSMRSTRSGRSRASEGGAGRRSESAESRSSGVRESGEWGGAWNAAMRASKLLWDEEEEEERPMTPSSATRASFSLPTEEEEEVVVVEEEREAEETRYADGTPVQYFLSGEVVPLDVRELIRAMTSPKAGDRPTALEVLRVLETL